ncbi:MAG: glycosyltransferase [Candidatus Omnitrophica bacterium]|nr:glycosyltransferase [Candidatus Omnitrophota bacterium]
MERLLLMFISNNSGHHRATLAIERAVEASFPRTVVRNINGFNYTHPFMEKVINSLYNKVIKIKPEVWEYLYDNPKIVRRTRKLRNLIHKFNSKKLKKLINAFGPDIVACTQAFPCGMIADLKKTYGLQFPLVGVLTDYAPHSYWIYDTIDAYVVPSADTKQKLVSCGIRPEKVYVLGIPVDPVFSLPSEREKVLAELHLSPDVPTVLIMGGGQGLGPIEELVFAVNTLEAPAQLIVVCGTNQRLKRWLDSRRRLFRKKMAVFGYVREGIHRLMDAADMIVSKPGGLTTAEALTKHLPIIIVNPIPGQEAKNTEFLLREGVAVKADGPLGAAAHIEVLLRDPAQLKRMKAAAARHGRPYAARDTARLLEELSKLRK